MTAAEARLDDCRRVLLTGASGFVGATLAGVLARAGFTVRAALRKERPLPDGAAETAVVGNVDGNTEWGAALAGVDFVIHAAARAHVLRDQRNTSELYFATNAEGTRRLAQQAAQSGIRRLVFLSSVKVNGEETPGEAYTAADEPNPQDDYGKSKWIAEQALAQISAKTGLQTVVVRAPLVYGPGVRANFLRLMQWVDRGLPLPLALIHNRRSLVSVWNLCDLLVLTLENPAASGRCWMVSDGRDLSTPEIIRYIGRAMARQPKLFPVPVGFLRVASGLLGRRAELARLCGSLVVDITETRRALGWSPPVTVEESLVRTVDWYRGRRNSPADTTR